MSEQKLSMAVKSALHRLIALENLRRAERREPPLTQTQIAKGAGVNQSVISTLVNGKTQRIDFRTIDGLCKFFEVKPGDLFEFDPKTEQDAA